ncbi:MAG: helix-turn-helix transcriptional regulator [Cyclobacteriaceae bacterium]|nr:helix-turn-helix transcriptional regulator [Cyclobacteriaceae bacterium]
MINFINEKNVLGLRDLPKNTNLLNLSSIKQIEGPLNFRSFSIKYVVDGCEKYKVNDNRYKVDKGEYILANAQYEGYVEIDSDKPVIGICIDIEPQLIAEIASLHVRPDTPFPDTDLADFFHSENFLDNKYKDTDTFLGKSLRELASKLLPKNDRPTFLSKELFYTLAEDLIQDHLSVFKQLNNVDKVKASTRKDIFRRVLAGKEFLDAHFLEPILIETAAKEAAISEYYFFKLFKRIYQITPYNYLIKKRMEMAVSLICENKINITDIALTCGFIDIHTFSKLFKKMYGCAPSRFML